MHGNQKHIKNHIMKKVLEVRYTDLEEEKRLCEDLFLWAKANHDDYALAFSYTYLGDYYIAQNDSDNAEENLLNAKDMLNDAIDAPEIALRVYSLLAILYEMKADEQSSIQNYMDALAQAKRLNDVASECSILNNLAFAFSRHKSYQEALKYFEDAYHLIEGNDGNLILPVLLSNLGGLLVLLDRLDEAKKYFHKCDEMLKNKDMDTFREHPIRNWCTFYAASNDKEKAIYWAKQAFDHLEVFIANKLAAFENFKELFHAMVKINHKEYATEFFKLMEDAGAGGGLDQQWSLEECRIRFTLQFEPDKNHTEAYRTFYIKTRELKTRSNLAIVNAMKAKINLNNAISQKEQLQCKQDELEREINLDELTQIYNRRYLDKLIRERKDNIQSRYLSIIMIDVDYFKEFNDFYGHLMGDHVLQKVAKILFENKTPGIYPSRYGGDEFCCVCDGLNAKETAKYIGNIRAKLEEKAIQHEKSHCHTYVTLSIGYACEKTAQYSDPFLLSQLADQALYKAKLSGRNSFIRKRAGDI